MSDDDELVEKARSLSASSTSRESTVVVDPISQIPDALPRFRREAVEKTEVLQGRRVDELRAELARKRKLQQRRQHQRLALWGAAGAGAVLLGALLAGLVFSGSSGAAQGATLSETEQELVPSTQNLSPTQLVKSNQQVLPESAESESAPIAQPASEGLSLDDLPTE